MIEKIGVVGSGLMGSGITEVCARAGLEVVVVEADSDAVERGRQRFAKSLETGVKRGKLSA
ncbi:MAG TPA: 3-hydroxyacyl-CoA dehydrogenase NAD-binding domain-containing protein, partial [Acidimicrobiales bacterium]|nr:3-hydroxyacyl-CoA dehydrogenase NAD-binding domain-containing protein [Acidimicrobiales bacterium]